MMINELLSQIPPMLTGEALLPKLQYLPKTDDSIRRKTSSERLIALSDVYKIFFPFPMASEIYTKLYLSLVRSLQKKCDRIIVQQQNENYKSITNQEYNSVIGGADSFTILGKSGIGKSSAINRAISIITGNRIIRLDNPFVQIIPCINIQCPFDASAKGLLIEILRKVDEKIGTDYYEKAIRSHATTDALIGSVSQVAINHIGFVVIDETQNLCMSKNGRNLIGCLTQLINNSGISICLVGTLECKDFFESAEYIARRTIGLTYTELPYDDVFSDFCTSLWKYQYVLHPAPLDSVKLQWLYEHSNGTASTIVTLFHDAQELAILRGSEKVTVDLMNTVYEQRMEMLYPYRQSLQRKCSQKSKTETKFPRKSNTTDCVSNNIIDAVTSAKSNFSDVLVALKKVIKVEEIRL